MYENLTINAALKYLDDDTISKICQKWPGLKKSQHSAKTAISEFDINTLNLLLRAAIKVNCSCLSVLALEVIIEDNERIQNSFLNQNYSEHTDIIKDVVVKTLQDAFDHHYILPGSTLADMLGFTLFSKCTESDYLLARYGLELSRGLIFMGPKDWFKETLKSQKAPQIAHNTSWAKPLIAS